MKVTVNIDCTPEEARTFFGLPDVKPMHEALLKEMYERLSDNLRAMEPEAIMNTWLPMALKGFEQWQEMILAQMASSAGSKK